MIKRSCRWLEPGLPLAIRVRVLLSKRENHSEHVETRHSIRQRWTKAFAGTLKTEMLQGGYFIDENHASTENFAYIDGSYNPAQRKYSALRYQSPSIFESNALSN